MELETPEEVQETLAEKGLDLTLQEIMTIKTSLENYQSGELSEEELACVAGGSPRMIARQIAKIMRVVNIIIKITRW